MNVKTFRDNLFSMNTRRFGRVAEIIVQRLVNAGVSEDIHHDLLVDGTRVEVKFSRVEKKHSATIESFNVLEVVEKEGLSVRMFPFDEWKQHSFDCNIQQVKTDHFDTLFYGLLFADRIVIFIISATDLRYDGKLRYSDKQHKGNVGEGQFHIKPSNLDHHLQEYQFLTLSYSDALNLLSGEVTA